MLFQVIQVRSMLTQDVEMNTNKNTFSYSEGGRMKNLDEYLELFRSLILRIVAVPKEVQDSSFETTMQL